MIFPAKPDYIHALRLAIAAVISPAGFTTDEIEDIKLLASQAFVFLILEKSEQVTVTIRENQYSLEITFCGMGYRDGSFAAENRDVIRTRLLKSLIRKRCTIEKGKIAACFYTNALNGCQNLQTY
jgi:anti-sigma regulatory factor (Ser/Thr protein kinase)